MAMDQYLRSRSHFSYHSVLTLSNLEATDSFGKRLGKLLSQGDIVLFHGEMGSGKTTLIKSICSVLGVKPEMVISPTYTLVNRYSGFYEISHVDLFRLEKAEELDNFDLKDLICDEGITLIEWPKFLEHRLIHDPLLHLKIEAWEEQVRSIQLQSDATRFANIFDHSAEYWKSYHRIETSS